MKFSMTRKTWIRLVGVVVLLLLVVWVVDIIINTLQLRSAAREVQTMLKSGGSTLKLDEMPALVERSNQNLIALRRDISPVYPVLRLFSFIQPAGQVEPVLEYAQLLVWSGQDLLQVFSPLLLEKSSDDVPLNQRIFQILRDEQARFKVITARMELADGYRRQINPSALPGEFAGLFEKVDALYPALKFAGQLLQAAPALMGADQPQTYLVIAQNRDEIRATGGFITAIGKVELKQGQLSTFEIGDSYAVDDFSKPYPPPPEPIQKYMLAGYWVTRDANWSPDFPTAARQIQTLYTLSTEVSTGGVISFDQSAVKGLLKVLGPVQLASFNDVITDKNVEAFMHEAWAPEASQNLDAKWLANRKKFIGELGKTLIQRLLSVRDMQTMRGLLDFLQESIHAGSLQLYFNLPAAGQMLAELELDGGIHPVGGDSLFWVDTNIGFNKVDYVMQRKLQYTVDLSDPQKPTASAVMTYTHPIKQVVACQHRSYVGRTYDELTVRCYWDYWRLLTPAGSRLLEAQTTPVPAEMLLNKQAWDGKVSVGPGEAGLTEFAGLMVLPTNQGQVVGVKYALPAGVLKKTSTGWEYYLRVYKQSGLSLLPLSLKIIPPQNSGAGTLAVPWQIAADGSISAEIKLYMKQDYVLHFEGGK